MTLNSMSNNRVVKIFLLIMLCIAVSDLSVFAHECDNGIQKNARVSSAKPQPISQKVAGATTVNIYNNSATMLNRSTCRVRIKESCNNLHCFQQISSLRDEVRKQATTQNKAGFWAMVVDSMLLHIFLFLSAIVFIVYRITTPQIKSTTEPNNSSKDEVKCSKCSSNPESNNE